MDKKDIFYYAKLHGIPIYFQPEENEVVARNVFCGLLLDIYDVIITPLILFLGCGFPIKIYRKTITRAELKQKGVLE